MNLKRYVRKQVRELTRSGELNAFLYSLSLEPLPEGMRADWNSTSAVYDWSRITNLHQSGTHLFVFFDGEPRLAIPEHAFRDPQEKQNFVASIERFRSGENTAATVAAPVMAAGGPWWRDRYAVDREEKASVRQRLP